MEILTEEEETRLEGDGRGGAFIMRGRGRGLLDITTGYMRESGLVCLTVLHDGLF